MKHKIKFLIICVVSTILCACDSKQLEPGEVFSEIERLINSAAETLEKVVDVKSAHQASQRLVDVSEELDEVILRVKPFDTMSSQEAAAIIEGFGQGRAAMARLEESVSNIKTNPEHWIVLESSVNVFGKSMEKAAVVMGGYIEDLLTQ